uniref:Uncharacterized protein n=2 Tax=Anguilla anguilla TaxID=7936 RepID=A0A0E9RQR6_ANGAN
MHQQYLVRLKLYRQCFNAVQLPSWKDLCLLCETENDETQMVDGLNWVCHNDKTRFFLFYLFFFKLARYFILL